MPAPMSARALSVPPSGFAIVWPATAFLISILLLEPPRRWWLYAAAIVPAHFHLASILQPEAPFVVVLTQVGGNLLLAAATVAAVDRAMQKPRDFDSFRSVLMFVLVAGLAVPALVNALILSVHLATGWTDNFRQSWAAMDDRRHLPDDHHPAAGGAGGERRPDRPAAGLAPGAARAGRRSQACCSRWASSRSAGR